MAKFIHIDHSIRGFGGHYYEYAVHVLRAAREVGYTPVLAANRDFQDGGVTEWKIYPVYPYDFWGMRESKARRRNNHTRPWRDWWFQRKTSLLLSKPGLLYLAIRLRQPRLFLRFGVFSKLGFLYQAIRQPDLMLYSRSLRGWSLLPTALAVFSVGYVMAVGSALKDLLYVVAQPFVRYIGNVIRHLWQLVLVVFYPLSGFKTYWPLAHAWHSAQKRISAFGKATELLFREVPLQEGDVVFIPTLSEIDTLGLFRYLQEHPESTRATWHLLFRRNIYAGMEPEYDQQEEKLGRLKEAFQRFRNGSPQHRVFFYTDTDRLTAQYSRLNAGKFHTLPIPVNPDFETQGTASPENRPLRVIYLGDARSEKGYQYLPRIVQDLWSDYVETGKVVFAFQSNFTFVAPQGEAAVLLARSVLEGMPEDKVQVIRHPLSTEEYKALLLSGDIVLILYESANYYARSSGILVEALTAGKPVIVPAGTWMAEQFSAATYRYHNELRQQADKVDTVYGSALTWSDLSDAEKNLTSRSKLIFGDESKRLATRLSRPGPATDLLLSFELVNPQPGTHVLAQVKQFDSYGDLIGKRLYIMGSVDSHNACSVMVPLDQETQELAIALQNAYHNLIVRMADVELTFFRASSHHPIGAVGLVYSHVDEISDLLREMIEHYAHYRRTAQAFSTEWVEQHSARRLVEMLTCA